MDLLHHRRRDDAAPDPHDPATCNAPTCLERRTREDELIAGYGVRICAGCGLQPAIGDPRRPWGRFCLDCAIQAELDSATMGLVL